jgi:hypothetical protein
VANPGAVVWTNIPEFTRKFGQYGERLIDELERTANAMAAEFAREAKANAPWNDITGAARRGLVGHTQTSGYTVTIVLAHTVEYGIWLEIRWQGKYAIIMPTLEGNFANVMTAIEALVK